MIAVTRELKALLLFGRASAVNLALYLPDLPGVLPNLPLLWTRLVGSRDAEALVVT